MIMLKRNRLLIFRVNSTYKKPINTSINNAINTFIGEFAISILNSEESVSCKKNHKQIEKYFTGDIAFYFFKTKFDNPLTLTSI